MARSAGGAGAAGFNPNHYDDRQITGFLRSGEHAQYLAAYFGEPEYRELRQLAKLAGTRANPDGPRVYLLPGIMGSRLGSRDAMLWLDPQAIAAGKMLSLALPGSRSLRAAGVMLYGYLELKLTLEIAGFSVRFHAYDWRQSLDRLGRELARQIVADASPQVMLVAHSMGGLVARAALALETGRRISRLVQLGTPNHGSFAPVQALRAVYPTVRKIATLDPQHSAEQLARMVFHTLPGLYQMLPQSPWCQGPDFFARGSWPDDELAPDARLLAQARRVLARLAPADERCDLIAGVNQATVTAATRHGRSFHYTITHEGDGTVPLASARWQGARTWFIEETHGGLANNGTVCAAVVDLLQKGRTHRLARSWKPQRGDAEQVSEASLRRQLTGKVIWHRLSLEERRRFLEPVISAEFHDLMTADDLASHGR